MKPYTIKIAAALLVLAAVFIGSAHAQVSGSNTDVPRILSYQGQVTSNNGTPMNGTHKIIATLYQDHLGLKQVWQSTYDADITNGIFTVLLGSGKIKLPETAEMNRPLWVGIKVDGGEEMTPLTQLSAAPYAINIPDNSITAAKLAPELQSALFGAGHTPKTLTPNSAVYWSESGNTGTTPGPNYIGTSDSEAFEIHVFDSSSNAGGYQRVMRYEPHTLSPNIIGGQNGNIVSNAFGSVICGGGTGGGGKNEVRSSMSSIIGGKANLIDSNSLYSTIVDGSGNTIGQHARYSYIGAGSANFIHDTSEAAVILGGGSNAINNNCLNGFIGGGQFNTIRSTGLTGAGQYCTITGGDNLIAQSYAQTVMGHYNSPQGTSITGGTINGDDRLLIIGNGVDTNHRSNAFEVSDNGHSIVHHTNGQFDSAITGGTYKDNIIYGWGYWTNVGGTAFKGFGTTVTVTGGTTLHVQLNLKNPDGSSAYLTNPEGAITVTPYGNPCNVYAVVNNLTNNGNTQTTFDIQFFNTVVKPPSVIPPHPDYWLDCVQTTPVPCMFIVTGRPH